MFSILRPFIFNLDPETAHDLAIQSLKFNPLPSKMFEVEDEQMLNIELLGKNFPNPIGLAAGFDKSAEAYNSLLKLGFGFVEVGTVTPLKQFGNPKPRIFRLEDDGALINRLGFNNDGMEKIKNRIKLKKKKEYWELILVQIRILKTRRMIFVYVSRIFWTQQITLLLIFLHQIQKV